MRYLALDPGDRRMGVAVSDTTGILARPLEVFARRSREQDQQHIRTLIAEHKVGCLIIGLPLNMNGSEGQQAAWVRSYAAALQTAIEIPIVLWDERLTTHEAIEIAHAQGRSAAKDWVDAVAAAVILQSYLDAQGRLATVTSPPEQERNPH